MAQKTSTQVVQNLVINKVDSKAAFEQMQANNQINANELYLVQEESESVMIVEITEAAPDIQAEDASPIISINKTFSEILTALNNSKPVIAYGTMMDGAKIIFLPNKFNNSTISFISQTFGADGMVMYIDYNSNGTITAHENTLSTQQTMATLTIGSYTYDGSSAVNIPVYDGTYTWG